MKIEYIIDNIPFKKDIYISEVQAHINLLVKKFNDVKKDFFEIEKQKNEYKKELEMKKSSY